LNQPRGVLTPWKDPRKVLNGTAVTREPAGTITLFAEHCLIEQLTAFQELESAISTEDAIVLDQQVRFFPHLTSLNGSESGGDICPAGFFALFRTRDPKINSAAK
jgi:hypothetical protein